MGWSSRSRRQQAQATFELLGFAGHDHAHLALHGGQRVIGRDVGDLLTFEFLVAGAKDQRQPFFRRAATAVGFVQVIHRTTGPKARFERDRLILDTGKQAALGEDHRPGRQRSGN